MKPTLMRTAILAVAITIAVAFAAMAGTTATGTSYPTPQKAVDAFITALRAGNLEKLQAIFGQGSEKLFVTEDPTADKNTRETFLALYDAKHVFGDEAGGAKMLIVGTSDWPFPIPLVKNDKGWAFDTPVGFEEIINRRIGRNELEAIQASLAIADAQREYYTQDRDGDGILEYAQKFRSAEGKRDGLYWPVKSNETLSPLGDLVAAAADDGYTRASTNFHGYHYRLLTSQGPSAPGGAYDYMVRNKQIGGFAILAYPAAYGETGIMTFMVSHSGIVYQRDLGASTADLAVKTTTFDPGQGWTRVSEKDLQPIPQN